VLRDAEVGPQLLSIAAGDQRGDGDQVCRDFQLVAKASCVGL
jgi:hypothetical protein